MNDTSSTSDFENALRAMAPVPPARSASDAAYEAGRRDAVADNLNLQPSAVPRQGTLWLHRLATAAALVLAGTLAWRAGESPEQAAPLQQARQETTITEPAQPPRLPLPARRDDVRPQAGSLAYLSLRASVVTEEGIELDRLWKDPRPAASSPVEQRDEPDAMSVADFMRLQRGF